jgi:hypothetical protein
MMDTKEAEALMKEAQQEAAGAATSTAATYAPEKEAQQEPKVIDEGVVELDTEQLLRVELVLMKRQKARLAEKLAAIQYKEAQRELMVSVRDEASVLARIAQEHGLKRFKSVKVVGPNKLAYTLG